MLSHTVITSSPVRLLERINSVPQVSIRLGRQLVVRKMTGISEGDGVHSAERIAASHECNTETGDKQSREACHGLTGLAGENEADVQRLPGNFIDLLDVEILAHEPTHDRFHIDTDGHRL